MARECYITPGNVTFGGECSTEDPKALRKRARQMEKAAKRAKEQEKARKVAVKARAEDCEIVRVVLREIATGRRYSAADRIEATHHLRGL